MRKLKGVDIKDPGKMLTNHWPLMIKIPKCKMRLKQDRQ